MNVKIISGQVIKLTDNRRYGYVSFEGAGEIQLNGFTLGVSEIRVRPGYTVRRDNLGNIFVEKAVKNGDG